MRTQTTSLLPQKVFTKNMPVILWLIKGKRFTEIHDLKLITKQT